MASKSLVVAGLVINAILWSQSRYGTSNSPNDALTPRPASFQSFEPTIHRIYPRNVDSSPALGSLDGFLASNLTLHAEEEVCKPLSFPKSKQCRHVTEACPVSNTFLSIPYLQKYFCAKPAVRPIYFAALFGWLVFLFSFIGITASDFFCPNLSTIAHELGLSDNIAGVTFLAFGNGSPDLFSTYSAMRTNSGSLAVGELLGAATFIISIVVGTLCIINPFHVRRGAFLRDVGFFTVAVSLLCAFLWDGRLYVWEAASMVVLYVVYVTVVIIGTLYSSRQQRIKEREETIRAEYADSGPAEEIFSRSYSRSLTPEPYTDDGPFRDGESNHFLSPVGVPRARAESSPAKPERRLSPSEHVQPPSPSSLNSTSHSVPNLRRPSITPSLPSFSLLGALEFRQVVNALEKESSAAALSMFESPSTPYAAGHYHRPRTLSASIRSARRHSSHSAHGGSGDTADSWQTAMGQADLPLSPVGSDRGADVSADHLPQPPKLSLSPSNENLSRLEAARAPIPSISISPGTPARGNVDLPTALPPHSTPPDLTISTPAPETRYRDIVLSPAEDRSEDLRRQRPKRKLREGLSAVFHTLFPTLRGWGSAEQSWLGRVVAIVAAPAVFLLTLSLPVVITSRHEPEEPPRPKIPEGRLVDIQIEVQGEADEAQRELNREEQREQEGESDVSSIMSELEREMHGSKFIKWLMMVQCIIGPVFITGVLFSKSKYAWMLLLAALVAGISAAVLVGVFAKTGRGVAGRITRSLMGFAVAVVWIMVIADEVVRVLQTFGFIFGLSDAIVGLTVFAIGNSLADWVANTAVAKFAPIMGFSACFGGPMLNMLMGIGISGSVVLRQTAQPYYPVEFNSTLLVSTLGLLALLWATLIFVPLNRYFLSKQWGFFLVVSYVAIMTTNIMVEVRRES